MPTFLFIPKQPDSVIRTEHADAATAFISSVATGISSAPYKPDPDDKEREDIMAALPDAKTVFAIIEESDAPGSQPFIDDILLNVAPVSGSSLMPLSLSNITQGRSGFVLTSHEPDSDLVLRSLAAVHGGVMMEKTKGFITPHDLSKTDALTTINRTGQPDTRNTLPMALIISEQGRSLSSLDVMAALSAAFAPEGYLSLTRRATIGNDRHYHVSITPKDGQRTSFQVEGHGPYSVIRPVMRNYTSLAQIIPFLGGDVCYRNNAHHSGSACAFGATRTVIADPDKALQLSGEKEKIISQCAANGVAALLGETNEVSRYITESVRQSVLNDCTDGMFIDEAQRQKHASIMALKERDEAQRQKPSPERA